MVTNMAQVVSSMQARQVVGFNAGNVPIAARTPRVKAKTVQQAISKKAQWCAANLPKGKVYIVGAISSTQNAQGQKVAFSWPTHVAHRTYFARVQNALARAGITNTINPANPKAFRVAIGLKANSLPKLNCIQALNAAGPNAISNLHATNYISATTSACVLVIMPHKSFASTGTQQELQWAVGANVPIYVF